MVVERSAIYALTDPAEPMPRRGQLRPLHVSSALGGQMQPCC
jgi:hypothetical protein